MVHHYNKHAQEGDEPPVLSGDEAHLEALPKKLVRSILTGTHELVHSGTQQLLEI